MARRSRVETSLFPFMSVLACTIGALVVLLAVLSLSSLGAGPGRPLEAAGGASPARIEVGAAMLEKQRAEREARRLALARAEQAWRKVDDALVARGLEPGLSAFEIDRITDRATRSRAAEKRRADLEAERRRLVEQQGSIETTIATLESRRETLPILIDPTGLSRAWRPFFIEADAGGATAYRASDDFSYFVPRDELATSGDFGRYLRRVRAEPGALIVVLVRPDGLSTTARIQRIAREAGIRVARLPLPGTGELDFRLLRRAEAGT